FSVNVFEFDSRFAVYGEDFVFFDYRSPLSVPLHLRDSFDVVVADPPYLEEDCLTKVALTIKMVSKPDAKIILCTGKVMEELAAKLMGLKLQNFEIKHEKERLSNPFGCFANYDLDEHCKY
ncbi:Protein-lysine N-methyltransferase Efm5, partial [Trinorchestia longiramus]